MKPFLLLLLINSVTTLFAQDSSLVYLDQYLRITTEIEGAAFTAVVSKSDEGWNCTAYYGANRGKAFHGTFKDKKLTVRNGWFSFFYPGTGVLMAKGGYNNNLQLGVWQNWYENGTTADSGRMHEGSKTGVWLQWYDNGRLQSQGAYLLKNEADKLPTANGQQSGIGANTWASAPRQRDVKHGVWMHWNSNGQKMDSVKYENGAKEGIYKSWFGNGAMESAGVYYRDKENAVWNWYYENGQPRTEEVYKNGKISSMKCFDTTGQYQGDFCSINKAAYFKDGGMEGFKTYVQNKISMPWPASTGPTSVMVNFTISPSGRATAIMVRNAPNAAYSANFKKLLEDMPSWEPAVFHNLISDFEVTLAIPYGLHNTRSMRLNEGEARPETDFRHRTLGPPMPQFYDVNWEPDRRERY